MVGICCDTIQEIQTKISKNVEKDVDIVVPKSIETSAGSNIRRAICNTFITGSLWDLTPGHKLRCRSCTSTFTLWIL